VSYAARIGTASAFVLVVLAMTPGRVVGDLPSDCMGVQPTIWGTNGDDSLWGTVGQM